jgi:hypothetical protein
VQDFILVLTGDVTQQVLEVGQSEGTKELKLKGSNLPSAVSKAVLHEVACVQRYFPLAIPLIYLTSWVERFVLCFSNFVK